MLGRWACRIGSALLLVCFSQVCDTFMTKQFRPFRAMKSISHIAKAATSRSMFSGIVEVIGCFEYAVPMVLLMVFPSSMVLHSQDVGLVRATTKDKVMEMWDKTRQQGLEVTIASKIAASDAYIGCSIAVNGVCLTVTSFDADKVSALCGIILGYDSGRRSNLKLYYFSV